MDRIPLANFGRDHWSTLAYLETRAVDHRGKIELLPLRCNIERHPHYAHRGSSKNLQGSRLRGGMVVEGHDDWDCIDDLEAAGLLRSEGTGTNPRYALTPLGWEVAGKLRQHLAATHSYTSFVWPPPPAPTSYNPRLHGAAAEAARQDPNKPEGACCNAMERDFAGGCVNCGDPCL